MKKILLITALFIKVSMWGAGQSTYYISPKGSDSKNGLSPATAWKSISKVNSMFSSFSAGDNILFKCGGTYYGSLIISKSGTSRNPIVISSYGNGKKPVITGFTSVNTWINLGANIWESKTAVSLLPTCNMVSVNGVNTPMGRYPDTGYLTIESHTGKTGITSSALANAADWTGAELILRVVHWGINRTKIISQSRAALVFNTPDEPTDGFGFFIQNNPKTLNTSNEWYYNATNKKLQIYSVEKPQNVRLATIDTLVYINGFSYINLSNISFQGSNKIGIKCVHASKISIKRCDFNYSGLAAIDAGLESNYLVVTNCTLYNSNDIAIINDTSNHTTITSNLIKNSGIFPGMGSSHFANPASGLTSLGHYGAIVSVGAYGNISNNKIDSSGYIGIFFGGDSTRVENNFINTYCFVLDDGGGIYSYSEYPNKKWLTRSIKNNTVLNGIGAGAGTDNIPGYNNQTAGIYLDASNSDFNVSGNTIAKADKGIFLNNAHEVVIDSNILYNNTRNLFFNNYNKKVEMKNIKMLNNIIIAPIPGQLAVDIQLLPDSTLPASFSADNNHYFKSGPDSLIINTYNFKIHKKHTLQQWQTFSGKDLHSKMTQERISQSGYTRLEYNDTGSKKMVKLSNKYIDVHGKPYGRILTLTPYSSAVLIPK